MINNLTSQKVSSTYGRLVQVVDGFYYDGLGNPLDLGPAGYDVSAVVSASQVLTLSAAATDYFGVSYSAGPSYVSLPDGSDGKVVVIKDESGVASLRPISVAASRIDSGTMSTIQINHGSITLVWRGSGWWII